jgi:hypothetical protein
LAGYVLAPGETSIPRIVQAIRQLFAGRSNASGSLTLVEDATTTIVSAQNCGAGCAIFLFPQTSNAAAALASTYIGPSDVTNGQFVIHHESASSADRSFWWVALG